MNALGVIVAAALLLAAPQFKSRVEVVRIDVLATSGGKPVTGLTAADFEVRETGLRSPHGRLLAWDWYRFAGRDSSNPYLAKAILARDRLLGRGDDSAAFALAAPYQARPGEAVEAMRRFMGDMLPAIDEALRAAGRAP